MVVDDKFVEKVGYVFPNFCAIRFPVDFVSSAFVEMKFGGHSVGAVEVVEFFDLFAETADWITRSAEHCDRRGGGESGCGFFGVEFACVKEQMIAEVDAHIRATERIRQETFSPFEISRQPLGRTVIPFVAEEKVACLVDEFRAPVACNRTNRSNCYCAQFERGIAIRRAEKSDSFATGVALRKRLPDETAVTMPKEKDGQMIFVFEPLAEKELVVESFLEDIAGVFTARLIAFRPAVSAVVVGETDISLGVEIFSKKVISSGVFAHAVADLNDALGRIDVVPKCDENFITVVAWHFELLHRRLLLDK